MHAPARAARATPDEPVVEEGLWAHARRLLRTRASAAAAKLLDAGVAFLQRLRKRTCGAAEAEGDDDDERPRSRSDRAAARPDAPHHPAPGRPVNARESEVAAEVPAPPPKRRLRSALIYLSVMLAGGMGGSVLAYELVSKLLDYQAAETRRVETAAAKKTKSAAAEMKKLEEAELKLQASLAEYAKATAENQKKLEEAEKRLNAMLADAAATNARRPMLAANAAPPHPAGVRARQRPMKTGNCDLSPGSVTALKGCIEDFNH